MKVTVIVENFASKAHLAAEYGLSLHIDAEGTSLLMDTGQRDALFINAPLLGIDLSKIDHIILSHGHFDHAGGLSRLLMKTRNPSLWAHDAFLDAHMRSRGGTSTFIGCHLNRESVKFHEIKGCTKICAGLYGLEIPLEERDPEFIHTPDHLVLSGEDGVLRKDPFRDDISLVAEGSSGLSIILGCAHAGVVNILEAAAKQFGTRSFDAVIGGMHLGDAPDEYVEKVTSALTSRFAVARWRPCHCTGIRSAWSLASKAGDVDWAGVGTVIDL